MATTNTQKDENHIKFSDQSQPADPAATRIEDLSSDNSASATLEQPPISVIDAEPPGKDGSESKTVGDPAEASLDSMAADNSAPISDVQKKMRRAERFGMPVQLSEEEKRNSRAERFGTGSSTNGSDALKKSEEQKRKARADRFGLVQSMPAEEEAKKKARTARFGTISKTDSLEEEKKKARAIRFSQQPSSSLSQVSDKGNIELKTVIAGKAGGGL